MTRVAGLLRPVAAGLALAAALAVALAAEDVRRWPARLESGDVRLAAGPRAPDPWRSADGAPLRLGARLLALEDDLSFRRAVRAVRAARSTRLRGADVLHLLARAESRLIEVERSDPDRRRRSAAANLLGIVYVESLLQASGAGGADLLDESLAAFRRSSRLDHENADAKFNLELLLALAQRRDDAVGGTIFQRGPEDVAGGRAGFSPPGEGY